MNKYPHLLTLLATLLVAVPTAYAQTGQGEQVAPKSDPHSSAASLTIPASISGTHELDQMIQNAEKPLTDFRHNYLHALEIKMREAQKNGRIEIVARLQKEVEFFNKGGWPDGSGVSDLDSIFIVQYWRIQPSVEQSLRAISGKMSTPEVNARIKERLDLWSKVPTGSWCSKDRRNITYRWVVTRDPIMSLSIDGLSGPRQPITKILNEYGVSFLEGASAAYSQETHQLVMTNLPREILKTDAILSKAGIRK